MLKFARYIAPHNAYTAAEIRFVPNFRELIVSWTPLAINSRGVERFVDEFLPIIRENNPQILYTLHRTPVLCDPFIRAIFEWGRKRSYRASFRHECQVLSYVQEMSIGGDFRPGRRRHVPTVLPRGQELWNTETRGHDAFKVLSKWKDDSVDPDQLTSVTHPHLVIRQMMRKRSEMDFE